MPAAAVIPAPIAYIKVVAVKKLVVGSRIRASGPPRGGSLLDGARVWVGVLLAGGVRIGGRLFPVSTPSGRPSVPFTAVPAAARTFTLKKLECSKQARPARIMVHGIME